MLDFAKGRYRVREAATATEIAAAQDLRHRAFHEGRPGSDADAFDPLCRHVLIEPCAGGPALACFRYLELRSGAEIGRSYAAQVYDLGALQGFRGPMLEIGRFCITPGQPDPDILRAAWGALTAHVDRAGIALLFGCASFTGTDPAPYRDAFGLLAARHVAPARWRPREKARRVVRFAEIAGPPTDARSAAAALPPLLRSYLLMGGWTSDHAVIDAEMNTLHVFTGVEIARIPETRKRLLRAVAR